MNQSIGQGNYSGHVLIDAIERAGTIDRDKLNEGFGAFAAAKNLSRDMPGG